MSISIGSSLNTQNVLTINSDNSNVINLDSSTSNVLINIGDFTIKQTSDAFSIVTGTDLLANFTEHAINIYDAITLSTSTITVDSIDEPSTPLIITTSNDTTLFKTTAEDNGTLYVGGHISIGSTSPNNAYSVYATSNIYTGASVYSQNVYTNAIYTDRISYNGTPQDPPTQSSSQNNITISSKRIVIDFDEVVILNQTDIEGGFIDLTVSNTAYFNGYTVAKHLHLSNVDISTNPLKIIQSLMDGDISNHLGNPISVISQMPGSSGNTGYEEILQLSAYGHLIMGGNVRDIENIQDYMIRGSLSESRANNFDGFLYFSCSNQNNETSSFVVNKEGHLCIGNSHTTSMFELNSVHETDGNIPTNMMTLSNTHNIPIMKCYSSNSMLHITENATLCFSDSPINITKYDIESTRTSYLNTIETASIIGIGSYPIDMKYSIMSNVSNIIALNITSEEAYIESLRVGNFTTSTSEGIFTITTPEMLLTGNTFAINTGDNFFSSDYYINNLLPLNNSFIIYTNGTDSDDVTATSIIGSNNSINVLLENTTSGGSVSYEMKTPTDSFKIGVQDYLTESLLYITHGKHGNVDAINVHENNMVKIGARTHVYPNGIMYIGYNTTEAYETFDTTTRLLVNGGIFVSGQMSITDNVRFGSGINQAYGGPYTKQYGWLNMVNGVYRISYNEYGAQTQCSGTLHIQIKTPIGKMGNIGVSFIKETNLSYVDVFVINLHKSRNLQNLFVTTAGTEIVVTTDFIVGTPTLISWTSIGSC